MEILIFIGVIVLLLALAQKKSNGLSVSSRERVSLVLEEIMEIGKDSKELLAQIVSHEASDERMEDRWYDFDCDLENLISRFEITRLDSQDEEWWTMVKPTADSLEQALGHLREALDCIHPNLESDPPSTLPS